MLKNSNIVGLNQAKISTPALLVDMDLMEYNLKTMEKGVSELGCQMRPHIKTHKSVLIAHKQIQAGAKGITCAKVGEAEVMVRGGITDVLIANQIVDYSKISRLAVLARYAKITVAVDDSTNLRDLSKIAVKYNVTLHVMVEVNVGLNRCGVDRPEDAVVLARLTEQLPNLVFSGIQAYEGRGQPHSMRNEKVASAMGIALAAKERLKQSGIDVPLLSCGSTGTWDLTAAYSDVNEMQAGTYVFMESAYMGEQPMFKPALTVLSTIISASTDRVVLDVGKKGITEDQGIPMIKDSNAEIVSLSEEHITVSIDFEKSGWSIGQKVELIPSHACSTVNLHDFFYGVRNGVVEGIYPVDARGEVD